MCPSECWSMAPSFSNAIRIELPGTCSPDETNGIPWRSQPFRLSGLRWIGGTDSKHHECERISARCCHSSSEVSRCPRRCDRPKCDCQHGTRTPLATCSEVPSPPRAQVSLRRAFLLSVSGPSQQESGSRRCGLLLRVCSTNPLDGLPLFSNEDGPDRGEEQWLAPRQVGRGSGKVARILE
jgi:hypothetical protein